MVTIYKATGTLLTGGSFTPSLSLRREVEALGGPVVRRRVVTPEGVTQDIEVAEPVHVAALLRVCLGGPLTTTPLLLLLPQRQPLRSGVSQGGLTAEEAKTGAQNVPHQ